MCRVLGVSRSGVHAWARRAPSARAPEDARSTARIRETHRENRWVHGSPRIHALVAVQDVSERRIVGWSMAEHMRTELVTDALRMALAQRPGATTLAPRGVATDKRRPTQQGQSRRRSTSCAGR
jgi:transposase InsO family protein